MKVLVSMRLDKDLKEAICKHASATGRTLTGIVNMLLREYLGRCDDDTLERVIKCNVRKD